MSHLGLPVVGDPLYGRKRNGPGPEALKSFTRQALHAANLGFDQPRTGKRLNLQSPVPADFAALLVALREDALDATQGSGR